VSVKEHPYFIPPNDGSQPFTVASLITAPIPVDDPPPLRWASGPRKVAIIGAAPSIHAAPWHDASWQIWGHATSHTLHTRADLYFDPHPWDWIAEKAEHFGPGYLRWLKETPTPVYMHTRDPRAPTSLRYPIERMRAEFPYAFGSTVAYMVAFALTQGVTHLGFFGVHFAFGTEYEKQRPNAEFWAGVAAGRGVQLVIPPDSPFCHEPANLYAYESHVGKEAAERMATRYTQRRDSHAIPQTLSDTGPAEHPELVAMGITKDLDRRKAMEEGRAPLLPTGIPAWTDDEPAFR